MAVAFISPLEPFQQKRVVSGSAVDRARKAKHVALKRKDVVAVHGSNRSTYSAFPFQILRLELCTALSSSCRVFGSLLVRIHKILDIFLC
jgi:hypothetical protein